MQITELAAVCHAEDVKIWFHVDAAYAGSALVGRDLHEIFLDRSLRTQLCPEFRHLFAGIDLAGA